MSRLDELIRQMAPEGVVFRPLGEVGQFVRGNGLQKADLTSWGTPAIHYGQVHTIYGVWTSTTRSFTSSELSAKLRKANTGDLIIATTSEDDAAVGKATAWLGAEDVAVSGDAYIYRHRLDPRYVSYFFKSEHFQTQKTPYITGTKVRRISGESLARIRIPVPPLEVQREIVRILDNFTELEAELETELEARRLQHDYFQRLLLLEDAFEPGRWGTLGEIGKVSMCKRVFKQETDPTGEVPFFKIGTFGGAPDAFISRKLFEMYRARYSFPNKGEVLISAAGTIGRAIAFDGSDSYFQDSNIVWISNDESIVLNRYLFHWYRVVEWTTDGSMIQRLYNENLRRARVRIPSLSGQARIVEALDKLDALVNDLNIGLPAELAARRKQYEYYRDKLLTFEELV